jgi:hypothetical protein
MENTRSILRLRTAGERQNGGRGIGWRIIFKWIIQNIKYELFSGVELPCLCIIDGISEHRSFINT